MKYIIFKVVHLLGYIAGACDSRFSIIDLSATDRCKRGVYLLWRAREYLIQW